MLTNVSFARLTQSLRSGIIADEILKVLKQILESGQVDDAHIPPLRESLNHLTKASKGYNWIKEPRADSESATDAFYFKNAVSALFPSVNTLVEFENRIDDLIKTTKALIAREEVDDENINELIDYFRQISTSELDNTYEILSWGAKESRRLMI